MNLSLQGTLFLLGLLVFIGVLATFLRLLRSMRHGLSIRLQVFILLAASSFLFNAIFAILLVENVASNATAIMPGYAEQLLADLGPKAVLLAVILGSSAALAAIVIGRIVGGPIEGLTRAAQRIAQGERQAALPVPRGKEVRALTHALESMRRGLEERHAIEAFVTDLSHELKNPIASIRAAAEVLEEGAAEDKETALRFARRIGESAQKLAALTSELLTLARVEAQGVSAKIEKVDLEEVACIAIEALASQAYTQKLQLDLDVKEPAVVRGQSVWLRRAIENLLSNAINHSPKGGIVSIILGGNTKEVEILVKDMGKGVDPTVQDKLFERFVSTRQGQGGTGLGLAIVRAIAESHGGRAFLQYTGTDGSVFALKLPRVFH